MALLVSKQLSTFALLFKNCIIWHTFSGLLLGYSAQLLQSGQFPHLFLFFSSLLSLLWCSRVKCYTRWPMKFKNLLVWEHDKRCPPTLRRVNGCPDWCLIVIYNWYGKRVHSGTRLRRDGGKTDLCTRFHLLKRHSHLPQHFQQVLGMVLEWLWQHHLKLKNV